MKKIFVWAVAFAVGIGALSSCTERVADDEYLEVIGEYEEQMPEAGFRLNLSYNGPIDMRGRFVAWADSLKSVVPSMVKTNESIYVHYMPEQMGKKVNNDMFQTSVTYILTVSDSSLYNEISEDLLQRNFPFSVNVMGAFMDSTQKAQLQQKMMHGALENAKTKIRAMAGEERSFEVVGIEELDPNVQVGPEYYEYNRRMISRLKVKAKLR